eukprot:6195036-Pleurochrysis_carterae.AAC.4
MRGGKGRRNEESRKRGRRKAFSSLGRPISNCVALRLHSAHALSVSSSVCVFTGISQSAVMAEIFEMGGPVRAGRPPTNHRDVVARTGPGLLTRAARFVSLFCVATNAARVNQDRSGCRALPFPLPSPPKA